MLRTTQWIIKPRKVWLLMPLCLQLNSWGSAVIVDWASINQYRLLQTHIAYLVCKDAPEPGQVNVAKLKITWPEEMKNY